MEFTIKESNINYVCDHDKEFDYLYITLDNQPSLGENIFDHVVLFKKLTGIDINGFKTFFNEIECDIENNSEGYITKELLKKIKDNIM